MKKTALILILLIFASLLVSCNNTPEPTVSAFPTSAPEPTAAPTTASEPTTPQIEYAEATETFTFEENGIAFTITIHGFNSNIHGDKFFVKRSEQIKMDIEVTNKNEFPIYYMNVSMGHRYICDPFTFDIVSSVDSSLSLELFTRGVYGMVPPPWGAKFESGTTKSYAPCFGAGKYYENGIEGDVAKENFLYEFTDGFGQNIGAILYDSSIYGEDGFAIFSGNIEYEYSDVSFGDYPGNYVPNKKITIPIEISVFYD